MQAKFVTFPRSNIFGLVSGTATDTIFPTGTVSYLFKLRAYAANIGSFFIGFGATGTVFELDAGDELEWTYGANLFEFRHRNPSGSSDLLAYWIQR